MPTPAGVKTICPVVQGVGLSLTAWRIARDTIFCRGSRNGWRCVDGRVESHYRFFGKVGMNFVPNFVWTTISAIIGTMFVEE